jgi:inosine-uridine nucleoside N-ribohydrolase
MLCRRLGREAAAALLAGMLALSASSCDVGAPPDSGQCVTAHALTCSKLTDVQKDSRPRVIFDTDMQFLGDPTTARTAEQGAVGDQYALIYLLMRSDRLQLLGVTTANCNGGPIDAQVSEAQRVAAICGESALPIMPGAVGSYAELASQVNAPTGFDGQLAVDFIIKAARVASPDDKLHILLGTKATNVALALTKDPTIAPNVVVHWTATDEPGAATDTTVLPLYRPGGSGMYNVQKDPDAANYLFAAPIDLRLMQLWDVNATPATQPRYGTAASGLGIKQAADLTCTGPRVPPVVFPDGRSYDTAGSYAGEIYATFTGNGVRTIDEATIAVLLAHPEYAGFRTVPGISYDPVAGAVVYPTAGTHPISIYDAIQGTAIGAEFVGTIAHPFISCEWAPQ